MKVFGMKQREPTDEDRVAVARLSAVAARFKGDQSSVLTNFTESSPDPLGGPMATEQPEKSVQWEPTGIADASEAPNAADGKLEPDTEE